MLLTQLLALSPVTGDHSPTVNVVVYVILGVALVSAILPWL